MNKIDYLIIFGLILILLVGVFIISYYFKYQNNKCISQPLVYAAQQYEESSGYDFHGFGYFKVPLDKNPLPVIFFNSTEAKLLD